MTNRTDRLCALTDSLPAAIRWRFSDYEQLLKKELKLLASPLELAWPPRGDTTVAAIAAGRARGGADRHS